MERAVLTFLMMAPNYGQEAWTIQSDPGISEKGDSYSNMTSHHRFSLRTFGMLTKFSHVFLKTNKQFLKFFFSFISKKAGSKRTPQNFSLSLILHAGFFFFVAAKCLSGL